MSAAAELDPGTEVLLESRRARRFSRLADREVRASIAVGVSFIVVSVPLALLLPTERVTDPLTLLALVAVYALLYKVEFEIGAGFAIPTQLAFVPMLFLLPLGLVPLCVAAGMLLGDLVEYLEGKIHLERVWLRIGNAWYAVGPVAVLAMAGEPRPSLDRWPVFVLALLAGFALDFAAASAQARIAHGISPGMFVRDLSTAWLVDAALSPAAFLAAIVAITERWAFLLLLPLAGLLRTFARERRARVDHALELSHAYRGTAMLLGDVVEADDAYTGTHSRDVVSLSIAVAEEMGLDARGRRDTEFVALLHDVGKIRIPNEIINKPGPLTPEERAVIETHTLIGEEMLDRVGGVLGNVGNLVRSCHERFDGGGYPDGLAGEEIPLVARIVCCCDAYSAITSDRPYRQGRSEAEALAELRRCAGAQFDPAVVTALEHVVAKSD